MTSTQSAACCSIPPIIATDYTPKGTYTTLANLKTYHTGPPDAKTAILIVYDIFGLFPQTLQGADILATSDKDHQYQVFIPDFFEGEPADIGWYPPNTEEKGKMLGTFFQTKAAPPKVVPMVHSVVEEIRAKGIEKTAILGMCWGAKIVSLTSGANTPFYAAAEVHPAMVDPADAAKVTIPLCMLASEDEDPELIRKFDEALTVKKHVETFGDQIHGWMGARSDLAVDRNREEYERGYRTVLEWFGANLKDGGAVAAKI